MEKSNTTRSNDESTKKDSDFDYYLKAGMDTRSVRTMLRSQGKSDEEIDKLSTKYNEMLERVHKVANKFADKLYEKYRDLDTPDLLRKGFKFADKYGLSQAEREAFINRVLKGDSRQKYTPYDELKFTEMSKFLGFADMKGMQELALKPSDYPALHEIARLYEYNRQLYEAVKTSTAMYKPCDISTLLGSYDSSKDNLNMFIHPVVAALFLPKIEEIDNRMLKTNIGRMVIHRSQPYFHASSDRSLSSKYLNWQINYNEEGIQQDLYFAYDIASDPNSLNYFDDETPMQNLLKRYQVQIELWKNILNLRQGKFYGKGDYYTQDDGIMGLTRTLTSYQWTFYDSPDMFNVQDEKTMLRKLLAVFSLRPTFTQSSIVPYQSTSADFSMFRHLKSVYVRVPIVNLTFDNDKTKSLDVQEQIDKNQSEAFVEKNTLVQKVKKTLTSYKLLFICVNRRGTQVNVNSLNIQFGFGFNFYPYQDLDLGTNSTGKINNQVLKYNEEITVGNSIHTLKSIIGLTEEVHSVVCFAALKCNLNTEKVVIYNPLNVQKTWVLEGEKKIIKTEGSNNYLYNEKKSLVVSESKTNLMDFTTEATILVYEQKPKGSSSSSTA